MILSSPAKMQVVFRVLVPPYLVSEVVWSKSHPGPEKVPRILYGYKVVRMWQVVACTTS